VEVAQLGVVDIGYDFGLPVGVVHCKGQPIVTVHNLNLDIGYDFGLRRLEAAQVTLTRLT
jgi:hypothetical protein